jgi:hypothetical protein
VGVRVHRDPLEGARLVREQQDEQDGREPETRGPLDHLVRNDGANARGLRATRIARHSKRYSLCDHARERIASAGEIEP